MRRLILWCLYFTIMGHAALAQPELAAKFGYRSFSSQGVTLPFRLFVPEPYDTSAQYPLILALHGSGERGTNNTSQLLANNMATSWANASIQSQYPSFIVAPQCPPDLDWSSETTTLSDLLDSLSREFRIDTNRLYITGLSMGGYGTWQMIIAYPGKFAAAVPMSGGWDSSQVDRIRNVPVWDFHGTLDPSVPVSGSRNMIAAFERRGRPAVYTDCHAAVCSTLPDSVLAMYVRSHSDLLYTEYGDGFHEIWNRAYATPLLAPWLFDKHRLDPGSIRITNLTSHESLSGSSAVQWEGAMQPTDSVEIWLSPDAGTSWQSVTPAAPAMAPYLWNTALGPDCAFALLKVFLKSASRGIFGWSESSFFTINNAGNGSPFVSLTAPATEPGQLLTSDSLTVRMLVGDPEDSLLHVRVLVSVDGGLSFSAFDSSFVPSDSAAVTRTIGIAALPNSDEEIIAVDANDGQLSFRGMLPPFAKQTPRLAGPPAGRVAGGGGNVTVNVLNPADLTGHLYRVSFHGTDYGMKSYDVTDVDRSTKIVVGATAMDGKTEGPLFDGIRLLVKDVPAAVLDAAGTRWESGAPTTMNVSVYLAAIDLGDVIIHGFPQAADYEITFSDQVVDTSSNAVAGLPAVPVRFSVRNVTENRRSSFIYVDADNSGSFSSNDEIHILELDSLGQLRITWSLTFVAPQGRTLPQAGDRFAVRTMKPIGPGDVFEFHGVVNGVRTAGVPLTMHLFQNYPNPFNPETIIKYTVAGSRDQGSGISDVKLTVYDVLGREVAVLVNEPKAPGTYTVKFSARGGSASGGDGSRLATGVYFCRLVAGEFTKTVKMLLLK